jgi:SAM-dependent methyltransferase
MTLLLEAKINLGAGSDIKEGFINHDIVNLPGIDVVHDLNIYPWPWVTDSANTILAIDVIEHLDEFIKTIEELHRVLRVGGRVFIRVPYWNSWSRHADPTHKRGFHELTFQFFNPESPLCKERYYYSSARFNIVKESFVIMPFSPYFSIPKLERLIVKNKHLKIIISLLANFLSGIIVDIEVELEKVSACR